MSTTFKFTGINQSFHSSVSVKKERGVEFGVTSSLVSKALVAVVDRGL